MAGGAGSEVISVADLVPVRRGSSPVRREGAQPQLRSDYYYGPFADFDELFDRMVSRFFAGRALPPRAADWVPVVSVEETSDAWIFRADLPGARREDIQVEVSESDLTITGKIEERERAGVVRRCVRHSDSFQYRAILPAGVDAYAVTARFDNGLLTVTVPRSELAKLRRLTIS